MPCIQKKIVKRGVGNTTYPGITMKFWHSEGPRLTKLSEIDCRDWINILAKSADNQYALFCVIITNPLSNMSSNGLLNKVSRTAVETQWISRQKIDIKQIGCILRNNSKSIFPHISPPPFFAFSVVCGFKYPINLLFFGSKISAYHSPVYRTFLWKSTIFGR